MHRRAARGRRPAGPPAPTQPGTDTKPTPVEREEPYSALDGNPQGFTPPKVALRARVRRSGVPAVVVTASCDERCRLEARGTLRIGSRTVRLTAVRRSAAANAGTTLTLRVPVAARRLVRRAKRVRGTLTITARDAEGAVTIRRLTVRSGR